MPEENIKDNPKSKEDKAVDQVYKDFRIGLNSKRKLIKEMRIDAEYALGKQWLEEDKKRLESRGIKAMTINKIKPMVKLVSGIERQGRTDFVAFPEGTEDEIVAEIVTKLLKNVSKTSRIHNKTSDVFKEGMTVGESFIEPYIDYTFDLINGNMRFRKINGSRIIPDPGGEEYDLSDGRFLIKITKDLSRDELLILFPGEEKKVDSIGHAKIDMDRIIDDDNTQSRDYPSFKETSDGKQLSIDENEGFDLIEYYYKEMIDSFYVAIPEGGILLQTEDKNEAEAFIAENPEEGIVIIKKKVPEIRLRQVVGKKMFSDDRAWSYPRWPSYPIVPFIAEYMSFDIDKGDSDLLIQGIVRGLRDLQLEYNKRRTQELHHLNTSVNSGMFIPEGALDSRNKDKLKTHGSSPGVNIFYKPDKTGGTTPSSWKMTPTPLSQGHAQLAVENAQDIKEVSGVNPDLLANESKSQSGRAILLKQRQGLIMIQEALDNYAHTKELLGRFILSQLGEIYTVESAMKVLGTGYLSRIFTKPVFEEGEEGTPKLDANGEIETEVDMQEATVVINKILNDASLGKFDVSIGDGPFNETIKFTNFMTLMEMVEKGIPIPPGVLIEESALSESQKIKIQEAIELARQAQGPPQA